MSKLAVIRVRGNTGIREPIARTLDMLNLREQHNCVIIEDTPVNLGMIQKVQSFVTFGPVTDETVAALSKARKIVNDKFYKLAPPKKGFERKGIKIPFVKGGALGNRGDNINDLIARMM